MSFLIPTFRLFGTRAFAAAEVFAQSGQRCVCTGCHDVDGLLSQSRVCAAGPGPAPRSVCLHCFFVSGLHVSSVCHSLKLTAMPDSLERASCARHILNLLIDNLIFFPPNSTRQDVPKSDGQQAGLRHALESMLARDPRKRPSCDELVGFELFTRADPAAT